MSAARSKFEESYFTELAPGMARLALSAGAVVFKQGEVADKVYYVTRGSVKGTSKPGGSREAVFAIHQAGDFLGEACITAGHARRLAAAVAMDDGVELVSIKIPAMRKLLNDPEFNEMFLTYMIDSKLRREEDLLDQLFNSSEKRLARYLLLASKFNEANANQPHTLDTKFTQRHLSAIVGTTRGRVSHFMNKFRSLGLLEYDGYDGKITVYPRMLQEMLTSDR